MFQQQTKIGWEHPKYGEQMETMLAKQNKLAIEHSAHIHETGQSMLQSRGELIIWRTQRQIQDYETTTEGQDTGFDGSTQN